MMPKPSLLSSFQSASDFKTMEGFRNGWLGGNDMEDSPGWSACL